MKAILTKGFGSSDVLELGQVDAPRAGPDEVLIQVCSSGLNGADLWQRRGHYAPPPGSSPLLGLEVSGTISALGSTAGRQGLRIGDRVMALLSGGGYAEQVAVRYDQIMLLPESMDLVAAGGIAEVFLTAYLELIGLAKLSPGQTLLIHAGASGVGTAAIQIARRTGAEIWVTASSESKLELCKNLGAHHLINYKTQDFAEIIKEETKGQGVNCILDLVGAAHFANNLKVLSLEGKLLLVGMGGGAKTQIDLSLIISKRLQLIGSTLRSRSLDEKARLIREFWQSGQDSFAHGEYRPVIDRLFSYRDVKESHNYMESQANAGKILLTWS